jgi:DNA repair exonuclease SbcCD ATPase subunit
MSSKPVVSTEVFIENVEKLKVHFDEIETFRAQVAEEAKEERRLFEEAGKKLEEMKLLSKEETEEFNQSLIDDSAAALSDIEGKTEEK